MQVRRLISLCLLVLTVAAVADHSWHIVDSRATHEVQGAGHDHEVPDDSQRQPGSHCFCPGHTTLSAPSAAVHAVPVERWATGQVTVPVVARARRAASTYRAHVQPFPHAPPGLA